MFSQLTLRVVRSTARRVALSSASDAFLSSKWWSIVRVGGPRAHHIKITNTPDATYLSLGLHWCLPTYETRSQSNLYTTWPSLGRAVKEGKGEEKSRWYTEPCGINRSLFPLNLRLSRATPPCNSSPIDARAVFPRLIFSTIFSKSAVVNNVLHSTVFFSVSIILSLDHFPKVGKST